MSKFTKASPEIEEIVTDIANEMGLAQYGIDFEALCVPKAKEVVQITKANALTEYITKRDDLILVICYEDAFDKVDDKMKRMWIRMAMDKVSFNPENGKISLDCPSITVPIGFYEKHKEDAVDAALLGKYTIAQIEEEKKREEDERKALRAEKKKQKANKKEKKGIPDWI